MSNVINVDFKSKKKINDIIELIEEEPKYVRILTDFNEISKKNKKNEERLKKERSGDNKNVLKAYRIK